MSTKEFRKGWGICEKELAHKELQYPGALMEKLGPTALRKNFPRNQNAGAAKVDVPGNFGTGTNAGSRGLGQTLQGKRNRGLPQLS